MFAIYGLHGEDGSNDVHQQKHLKTLSRSDFCGKPYCLLLGAADHVSELEKLVNQFVQRTSNSGST